MADKISQRIVEQESPVFDLAPPAPRATTLSHNCICNIVPTMFFQEA